MKPGTEFSSPRAAHLFRNQLRERSHPFCSAASSEEEEREPYAATSSVPRRREEEPEPSSLVRRGVPEHTRPRQVTQQPGRGAEENPYAPSEEEPDRLADPVFHSPLTVERRNGAEKSEEHTAGRQLTSLSGLGRFRQV